MNNLKSYATPVLRYAMALVILWFGIQQLVDTANWVAYIPDYVVNLSHLSVTTLVYINGSFELVFGLLLLFGWKTRIVAFLLALHLFDIMFTVGYGQIGVRDFGLAVATLVVFMNGADIFSVDQPVM